MTSTLTSDQLVVTITRQGAELQGITGAAGTQFLWQGDPGVWSRRAPVLFPIVGRLQNDRYSLDGQSFDLKQHGFARDSLFELVRHDTGSARFRLQDTPETRASYPFAFTLDIEYALRGAMLQVAYEVVNHDQREMPFSIGGHPGFACSWRPEDHLTDYYIELERPETAERHLLEHGLLSGERRPLLDGQRTIDLDDETFSEGALVFKALASERISLCHRRLDTRLTVAFQGFPALGIWSKPGAPFVCIEPWFGHADTVDAEGDLRSKPGILSLEPGAAFGCAYGITVGG